MEISGDNIEIGFSKITGIPYVVSTEVKVKRWD